MISTTFYLDKRYKTASGLYLVKIRITSGYSGAYIATSVELQPKHWDARARAVIGLPNRKALNDYLLRKKWEVDDAIRLLEVSGRLKSLAPAYVRDAVLAILYPEDAKAKFVPHYEQFRDRHENARTREIYAATLVAMRRFDPKVDARSFDEINKPWLDRFFAWLAHSSPSVNARNIHLRNIRAAFNDAIDDEITTCYPFRKVRIKAVPTKKRSLSVADLRAVFSADVPEWARKYVDAFRLQFCLIGINTIDLCHLTQESIQDGRLEYQRAKTKRLYSIKIEPEAMNLISTYAHTRKVTRKSPLLRFAEGCANYRHFAQSYNDALKIARPGLTTYYARHTWATIAAQLEIPKETISAALGHGGNTVTDIYIDFDRKKIDEANRKVLDFVFKGIKPEVK